MRETGEPHFEHEPELPKPQSVITGVYGMFGGYRFVPGERYEHEGQEVDITLSLNEHSRSVTLIDAEDGYLIYRGYVFDDKALQACGTLELHGVVDKLILNDTYPVRVGSIWGYKTEDGIPTRTHVVNTVWQYNDRRQYTEDSAASDPELDFTLVNLLTDTSKKTKIDPVAYIDGRIRTAKNLRRR